MRKGPDHSDPSLAKHRSGWRTLGSPRRLLDLGFFELDVLARDGIVLAEGKLFRLRTGILLGHVEEARVSRADQLDLHCGGLRHGRFLKKLSASPKIRAVR
jgi:hypothetical protein